MLKLMKRLTSITDVGIVDVIHPFFWRMVLIPLCINEIRFYWREEELPYQSQLLKIRETEHSEVMAFSPE